MGWLSNPDVRSAISSLYRKLRHDKQGPPTRARSRFVGLAFTKSTVVPG